MFTDEVPDAAVLGSFWAVPQEGRLISMLAGWKSTKDSDDKQMPCTQLIEILLANKGTRAKVELQDKSLYSGVIQEVLVDKTDAPVPPSQLELLDLAALSSTAKPKGALMSSRVSPVTAAVPASEHTLTAISGSNFVLRTDEGDILLPVGQVRSIMVKDMKTTIAKTLTTSKKTKRLSFKFEGAEKKQTVSIMYFRPGIRWIPTYRVSLDDQKDKKTAAISLQAELLNEAEDLNDVPVDIVVGVPNFRFRGTPSPLVLEATLRNALAEAAPDLMGNSSNSLSNAMYSQRSSEFRRDQAQANPAAEGVVNLPNELTAGGAQDLFVYNLPKLTLGKSERMAVPIFSTEVPYRDLYTWDVHITKHDNDAAPSGSGTKSPLTLAKNEVWHQIVLTNSTKPPWHLGQMPCRRRSTHLLEPAGRRIGGHLIATLVNGGKSRLPPNRISPPLKLHQSRLALRLDYVIRRHYDGAFVWIAHGTSSIKARQIQSMGCDHSLRLASRGFFLPSS